MEPARAKPGRSLDDPRLFINREPSSLAFNERVLEEACDPTLPALERLTLLGILGSNLDEFFMIRVAGLKQQLAGRVEETGPDAMTPAEQLAAIAEKAHELVARQRRALLEEVLPTLQRNEIRLLIPTALPDGAAAFIAQRL